MLESIQLFLQKNSAALTVLCVIGLIISIALAMRGTKDEVKHSSKLKIYIRRSKMWLRRLYIKLMHALGYIPIVGDLVNNTSYAYQCHEALTEDAAVVRTGRTLFWTIFAFVAMMLLGLAWFNDIVLSLITSFIVAHIVCSSMRSNAKRFLSNLSDIIEDFLLAYHKSSENIDEAFFVVSKSVNPVSRHFDIMYQYIQKAFVADDPDVVQSEYNAIAPSRYLRNLYAVIYMTYKHGDPKNNGRSALNANIMEVQEQINDALYQQNKLLDETMGERWFILVPIFAIPLLADYMLEYFAFEGFEYIESFLTSSTGYMVQTLCAIISLVCYMLYTEMINRGVLEIKTNGSWENKALRNQHIRNIAYTLLPLDSPKRQSLQSLMNRAGVKDTVNALQLRRIFLAGFLAIVSIVSVSLNVISNTSYINNDIYTGLPRENFSQAMLLYEDTDYYAFIDDTLDADAAIIKYMNKEFVSEDGHRYAALSDEDKEWAIRSYMTSSGYGELYREDVFRDYAVTRIMAKINQLDQVSGLNNLLFVVLMVLFGYFAPLMMLYLESYMNKDMLLLDEVNDLQKTTIMLMEYPSTTPDSLLAWYASSSVLMAASLRECRITHDFEALAKTANYKPFSQIVSSLEMAFNGLPLREAFSGVEQRLLTQRKEQSRIMERMLKFRVDTIELMASISMGAVIGLYMFMPLAIAMLQMFFSLDVF